MMSTPKWLQAPGLAWTRCAMGTLLVTGCVGRGSTPAQPGGGDAPATDASSTVTTPALQDASPPEDRGPKLALDRVPLALGYHHGCYLREDGAIRCWGSCSDGKCQAPRGDFVQVAAGTSHSCALDAWGRLLCWGEEGEAAAEAGGEGIERVVAFGRSTCALDSEGVVRCWGEIMTQILERPQGAIVAEGARAMRSLDNDLYILTEDRRLLEVTDGQALELPADIDPVVGLEACVVDRDGDLHCVDGGERVSIKGRGFVDLVSGDWGFSTMRCAIDGEGEAACWKEKRLPEESTLTVRGALVFGDDAICETTGGAVECWGVEQELLRWSPGKRYVSAFVDDGSADRFGTRRLCLHSRAKREWGTVEAVECFSTLDGEWYTSSMKGPERVSFASSAHTEGQVAPSADGTFDVAPRVTCRIVDDRAVCESYSGALPTPQGPAREVTTDGERVCVLRPDTSLACAGEDAPGPGGKGWHGAILNGRRLCALNGASELHCWPALHETSSLNNGTKVEALTRAPNGSFCAIMPNATVQCSDSEEPYTDARPIVSFASTGWYRCGVRDDGALRCWGNVSIPSP